MAVAVAPVESVTVWLVFFSTPKLPLTLTKPHRSILAVPVTCR